MAGDTFISCYPNAGLPNPMSETGFDETPEITGGLMEEFAQGGLPQHRRRLLRHHARAHRGDRAARRPLPAALLPGAGPAVAARAAPERPGAGAAQVRLQQALQVQPHASPRAARRRRSPRAGMVRVAQRRLAEHGAGAADARWPPAARWRARRGAAPPPTSPLARRTQAARRVEAGGLDDGRAGFVGLLASRRGRRPSRPRCADSAGALAARAHAGGEDVGALDQARQLHRRRQRCQRAGRRVVVVRAPPRARVRRSRRPASAPARARCAWLSIWRALRRVERRCPAAPAGPAAPSSPRSSSARRSAATARCAGVMPARWRERQLAHHGHQHRVAARCSRGIPASRRARAASARRRGRC